MLEQEIKYAQIMIILCFIFHFNLIIDFTQYFWRRRMLMGKPLLEEHNIGSIILENPFYGLRKPEEQQ